LVLFFKKEPLAFPSCLPLASRVSSYPRAADAEAAKRFLADFYMRVPDGGGVPRALLECLGGNSPYLSDLALREPETLMAVAAGGADAVCDQALGGLARLTPGLPRGQIASGLRHAKRGVALAAAVGDISGAWTLDHVTGALSDLADGTLRVCVAHLLRHAHNAGALRLPHPAAPERGSGFVVLAMGKLGARELNFSSDVDLILLYDPALHAEHADEIGQVFARMARDLVGLMEARDAGGYVFRVDLRLRPDPGSTPPAISLPTALGYYESLGQTWERAALIKARPVAGDIALGRRFLDEIKPFIWRRHLDFAVIADIHAMKHRMDAHKGTRIGGSGPATARLLGHDLKLGEGGIREVEFSAQTLQLVWGGSSPALRVPGTLAALRAQAARFHLAAEDVAALQAAYLFLRRAEHRLQMVADRQTHSLPDTLPGLERFAIFMGFAGADAFAAMALDHMQRVHAIFQDLFAALPAPPDTVRHNAATAPPPKTPILPQLPELSANWLAGRPRALRTERGRALLRDMLPAIAAALGRQPDPQAAMARFDEFIHRLPAGVQVLSMLQHTPALLHRLADVLGAAPWLADHLASFPTALEGLAVPQPIDPDPATELAARLRDARAVEDALAIASRMVRAEEFAIASAEFFGRIDVDAAGLARTALADAVIAALLAVCLRDHTRRYGRIEGGGVVVVALGKAGSREMMAGSDLDLMLIYDHAPHAGESDGPRQLAPSQYFARAAQSLVAALTVPTRHGPLYPVDMRLRPSGRSGPVAVSLPAFTLYHATSAWTWARRALTRARGGAGPAKLRRRVQAAIAAAIAGADTARVLADTAEMRARLWRETPPRTPWDVKLRPGGLMEVEFIAQALQLMHAGKASPGKASLLNPVTRTALHKLSHAGVLPAEDAALLIAADRTWRSVQGVLRIALGRHIPTAPPPPVLEKLLQVTGLGPDDVALRADLDSMAAQVRAAFVRHVGEIG
jgi:glutamate-ammonia-ligase adenylyltransferase